MPLTVSIIVSGDVLATCTYGMPTTAICGSDYPLNIPLHLPLDI